VAFSRDDDHPLSVYLDGLTCVRHHPAPQETEPEERTEMNQ
jgi:hypothetical protein